MTSHNDKPADKVPAKDSSQTTPAAMKQGKSKAYQKCVGLIGPIALIISIIALLGLVIVINEINSAERNLNQDLEIANNTIADIVEQQREIKKTLTNSNDSLNQQQKRQENVIQALNTLVQERFKEQHYQAADWRLVKAQYFLEMAEINAQWQQASPVTLTMLQQADSLLQGTKGTDVYSVRQAIAKEINTLQQQKSIDYPALLSQLEALSEQILSMRFVTPTLPLSQESGDNQPDSVSKNNWRERWANSVHVLEKLVIIRHHQGQNMPVMMPAQQELIKESINLSLQQAQWAVMQKNQKAFEQALKRAKQQVMQLPLESSQNLSAIITSLDAMAQQSLLGQQYIPSQALLLLNALIEKKIPSSVTSTDLKQKDDAP